MFKIYDGRSQFYQWDIDRKLIVEDASVTEVHFCNRTDDCSLVCEVYDLDGLRVADVPNILLQQDWRINVYAYDSNYTKHCEKYDVVKRSKPADYVYTETEIKNYDDLVERVDQIEKNGVSDETVAAAVEKYLEENDIQIDLTGYATEVYVQEQIEGIDFPETDLTGYATEKYVDQKIAAIDFPETDLTGYATEKYVAQKIQEAQLSGGDVDVDLSDYYTKSEVDAAIEEIELTPGPAGKDGEDGKDGKDGYTPVKGVDYFDGAPGAPGEDGKDYVLTDADKAEIAALVPGADVDLTDYYTKEEINDLLANLPSGGGDLPAAEGVGF